MNHNQHSDQRQDSVDEFRTAKLRQYFVEDPDQAQLRHIFWENQEDLVEHLQEALIEIRNFCYEGIGQKLAADKDTIFKKITELLDKLLSDGLITD